MAKRKVAEAALYPVVRKWAARHFQCFQTNVDVGLKYSRADVFCIRDTGGDLTTDFETIVIEVKKGRRPFAKTSGQAYGYRVYANRVYLADYREAPFNRTEREIAAQLGIGLIQITTRLKCKEVQASPRYEPIPSMATELLERVKLGTCRVCGDLFQTGASEGNGMNHQHLVREDLRKAIEQKKGLLFWNYDLGERKKKVRFPKYKNAKYDSFERRFVCSSCIENLWAPLQLLPKEK